MRSGGQEEGEGGKVEVGAIGRRHASALGPLSVVFCQMDVAHTNGSRAQNGQRAEPLDALAMERQQEQAFVLKHGSLNIRTGFVKFGWEAFFEGTFCADGIAGTAKKGQSSE